MYRPDSSFVIFWKDPIAVGYLLDEYDKKCGVLINYKKQINNKKNYLKRGEGFLVFFKTKIKIVYIHPLLSSWDVVVNVYPEFAPSIMEDNARRTASAEHPSAGHLFSL